MWAITRLITIFPLLHKLYEVLLSFWVSEVVNLWSSHVSGLYQIWPIYVYWEWRCETGCLSSRLIDELVQAQVNTSHTFFLRNCVTFVFCLSVFVLLMLLTIMFSCLTCKVIIHLRVYLLAILWTSFQFDWGIYFLPFANQYQSVWD